jgi:hypothetical protein
MTRNGQDVEDDVFLLYFLQMCYIERISDLTMCHLLIFDTYFTSTCFNHKTGISVKTKSNSSVYARKENVHFSWNFNLSNELQNEVFTSNVSYYSMKNTKTSQDYYSHVFFLQSQIKFCTPSLSTIYHKTGAIFSET